MAESAGWRTFLITWFVSILPLFIFSTQICLIPSQISRMCTSTYCQSNSSWSSCVRHQLFLYWGEITRTINTSKTLKSIYYRQTVKINHIKWISHGDGKWNQQLEIRVHNRRYFHVIRKIGVLFVSKVAKD